MCHAKLCNYHPRTEQNHPVKISSFLLKANYTVNLARPKSRSTRVNKLFLSYFFVKEYLLVGASGMLWTGQWVSE